MEIRILGKKFDLAEIIDDPIELRYTECFRKAGELYMRVPFERERYSNLATGSRIMVEGLIFTVNKVRVSENEIIVEARGLFDELRQIYLATPEMLEEKTPVELIEELVGLARFNGVNYTIQVNADTTGETVKVYDWCASYYEIIASLFNSYGLGYRMVYDDTRDALQFRICPLIDKVSESSAMVLLSQEKEDFELIRVVRDDTSYKNFITVREWFEVNEIMYEKSYDHTATENKRELAVSVITGARTEKELYSAFDTVARNLFNKHRRVNEYTILPLRELGIELGDVCRLECPELDVSMGALVSGREVYQGQGGSYEHLILEVDHWQIP